jgi:hypothetical protein
VRRRTKVTATTRPQPTITRPLRIITVKRPNITKAVITRRPAITPTWRMRMDCTRPIMAKRPRSIMRNSTRNTTKTKNGKRPFCRDLTGPARAINARAASIAVFLGRPLAQFFDLRGWVLKLK